MLWEKKIWCSRKAHVAGRERRKVRVVDEFRVTDLCMCTEEMRVVDRKYRAVGHLRKLDLFS